MNYFPAFKPCIDKDSIININNELKKLAISGNFGESIKEVEYLYSKLHSNYEAVLCSSGTSALHLACLALGVNDKSTVVVPATTNMATFFAPIYCGAKVIPCDVDEENGLISFQYLDLICRETKVDYVMPVHLYGHIVDPYKLSEMSNKYKFKVIEDCAEAHFASWDNKSFVGSQFDAGCFSFYANKIISCGEGGIVLFKNKKDADIARSYKNLSFGSEKDTSKFFHKKLGFNYRLSNLQASLLLSSIERKDEILKIRRTIASYYDKYLKNKSYIKSLYSQIDSYRVNWVYGIKLQKKVFQNFSSKNQLIRKITQSGVEVRDYFYPADQQDFLINYSQKKGYQFNSCDNAYKFYYDSIYLPVYEDLKENDVKNIVGIIDRILEK